jgi:hypothetical protein
MSATSITEKVLGPTNNIGHVVPAIALAGDVHVKALETKRVDKVLPKANKLLCEFNLVGNVWDPF